MTFSRDLQRSRLTVFFRLILAIPQLLWLAIWGLATEIVVFLGWFAALFMGRLPDGFHSFIAQYLRCYTRVSAYLFLLSDPWPPFGGQPGGYSIEVNIAPPQEQSRVTVFFRLILAIPALLLVYVFRLVNEIVAFLGWFYCLATGQMNEGMQNVSAWMLHYEVQTFAYILLLTGRYPSLSSGQQP
jgi:hypothetical protein